MFDSIIVRKGAFVKGFQKKICKIGMTPIFISKVLTKWVS